jgi:hypothetical protein
VSVPLGTARRWTLHLSIVFYAASLFLPAFHFQYRDPLVGFTVLLWGWWGLLLLNPAWLANVVYPIAILSFYSRRYERSVITAFVTALLGLASLFAKEWSFNEGSGTPIKHLGVAFYLWEASFLVLFGGSYWIDRMTFGKSTGDLDLQEPRSERHGWWGKRGGQ